MTETFGHFASALCGATARRLGWRPDEFWRATPDELAAILASDPGGDPAPIDRATLQHLMEQDHG